MRKDKSIGFSNHESERTYKNKYNSMLNLWPDYTQRNIETPQGTSHVLVCGPKEGSPLILLHGRYTPSVSWTPMITELAKYHRIYAVDTMGEPGMSVSNGFPLRSAKDYVGWLSATLEGLKLDSVHIAAHSFSGWYATHFALDFPERIKTLTLLDPAQVFAQFSLRWLIHCLPPYLLPSERIVHPFFYWMMQGNKTDPDLLELLTIGMTSYRANKEEASLISDAKLSSLIVPTQQILAGDTVVHRVAKAKKRAKSLTPHVQTAIIHECSHMIQTDQPKIAVKLILKFTHKENENGTLPVKLTVGTK
ncbi:alpha/beta fold hydrolase [Virgibacillus oceani]